MATKNLKILFFTIAGLEILSEMVFHFSANKIGIYIFKPLLMPALMLYFYYSVPKKNLLITRLLMISLFFSFLGDVFLMLPFDGFILGLGSFLIAHLLYVFVFWKENSGFSETTWITVLTRLMILLFPAAILFGEMQKNLGNLILPVSIYILVIESMGLTAWLRREYQSLNAYFLTFLGALLFIFSDSTIAFNKFIQPFDFANVVIMVTYILGQYFIIEGLIHSQYYVIDYEKN
jgi:uncharacterized membrane protein YhhN